MTEDQNNPKVVHGSSVPRETAEQLADSVGELLGTQVDVESLPRVEQTTNIYRQRYGKCKSCTGSGYYACHFGPDGTGASSSFTCLDCHGTGKGPSVAEQLGLRYHIASVTSTTSTECPTTRLFAGVVDSRTQTLLDRLAVIQCLAPNMRLRDDTLQLAIVNGNVLSLAREMLAERDAAGKEAKA